MRIIKLSVMKWLCLKRNYSDSCLCFSLCNVDLGHSLFVLAYELAVDVSILLKEIKCDTTFGYLYMITCWKGIASNLDFRSLNFNVFFFCRETVIAMTKPNILRRKQLNRAIIFFIFLKFQSIGVKHHESA